MKEFRKFENVAKIVRNARSRKPNLSQISLSNQLGYRNAQFISNIERALCSVPIKKVNKLCELLEIDRAKFKKAMMKDFSITYDLISENQGR